MKVTSHIDGGSRGNPGPAGAGVVLRAGDGRPLLEAGYFLGRATNNVAEYSAFLRGVEAALDLGASCLTAFSDSELLVKQVNGQYRVKNPTLKGLHKTVMARLSKLEQWKVRHVPREMNERADELANAAMDAGADVVELDAATSGGGRQRGRAAVSSPSRHGDAGAPAAPASRRRGPKRAVCAPEDHGENTPSEEPAAGRRVVIARCIQSANPAACRKRCSRETTFVFEDAVPAGICIGVAAELIRAASEAGSGGDHIEVACPHAGCGARFEVRAP